MDTELLRFSDYFRKVPRSNLESITPYMWVYNGKAEWYVAPSKADKTELADAACEYVNLFTSEQQEQTSMSMSL